MIMKKSNKNTEFKIISSEHLNNYLSRLIQIETEAVYVSGYGIKYYLCELEEEL